MSNNTLPARWRPWLLASRPKTLSAAIAPVIVGTTVAVAVGHFRPGAALAALVSALFIQIGTNFANDLGDYRHGADHGERFGPTRVTTAGLLSPSAVATGMWVNFGLAALAGLYLIHIGGWPVLLAGALSIAAGIAYTAGPLPLGYYGLGDLATFIFFGLVAVIGTYYVQALEITRLAVTAALPMGAIITAILVVNNLRDVDGDRAAGKRTLAVLLGRAGARAEYVLLMLLAYVVPFELWLGMGQKPWILLPLLTAPMAVKLVGHVYRVTGRPLNETLAGTARLAVFYALAFAAGMLL